MPAREDHLHTRQSHRNAGLASDAAKKSLNRFIAHRVFYEVSSRNKRGHEFFSTKNVFVVGLIEVTNFEHLKILIFDANSQAHSIEILNPQTMRIYDELPGRGFAVSFISAEPNGVETRCYIRDEGEEDDRIHERTALERITLPQLFEYLEEITAAEPAAKRVEALAPARCSAARPRRSARTASSRRPARLCATLN